MPAYKDTKRGTWYTSFYYQDWTGKHCRKLKRGFRTKREALDWEMRFKSTIKPELDTFFGDFVKVYGKDIEGKIRRTTYITKKYIIEKRILPYFANFKMKEITADKIIHWQQTLTQSTDRYGRKLSDSYINTCLMHLNAIFNHAVRYYHLSENPVQKVDKLMEERKKEMQIWTFKEYQAFLEAVSNKELSYHAFQILYWCGIRTGELLALTKSDFDLEEGKIKITKSFQRLYGEDILTPPKTKKGYREVYMPDFLLAEMKCFFHKNSEFEEGERIFPFTKSYLHKEMNRGSKKAGVSRIRIHDLRHSHVSLLCKLGYSAVDIGGRVGHESVQITFRYAHMFPSVQLEMAKSLDQFQQNMKHKNN